MNQMYLILIILMNRISNLEKENQNLRIRQCQNTTCKNRDDITNTYNEKNLEEELAKVKKELEDAECIVKNMKDQYEELMNTAQSYKDEASKWHYLYHTRKATKVEN